VFCVVLVKCSTGPPRNTHIVPTAYSNRYGNIKQIKKFQLCVESRKHCQLTMFCKRFIFVGNMARKKPKNVNEMTRLDNLEDLPPECILGILEFPKATNLNKFACCSTRCDQVRNAGMWSSRILDPRITYLLDTTRTGVVTIKTNGATYVNLLDAIICGEWNNHRRSANRTRLELYAIDKLEHGLTHQCKMIAHLSHYETV
jgi:hypothetical protein